MANDLMRITPAGGVFASLDGAKEVFDQDVVNAFGGDIDKHSHTPQEQFSAINASVWAELTEEIARGITFGTDLDAAPGKFLDSMGSLLSIRRRPATKTRVVCQSTGLAGLVIPQGSIVQDAAGNRFTTDQDVSIPSGGVEANIPCTAIEYGPIAVPRGSVNKIISVLNGWDTLTNNEEGIPGSNRESDTEYRANIKARTAQNASASKSAMESALAQAGSTKFRVIENPSNSPSTIGGVTIPPHSVVVAAGGGLIDDIARAVNNSRGMGVNLLSAIEGRSDYSKSLVSNMNAARFVFNGTTYKDIDLSAQGTPEALATKLNAYPSKPITYPNFTSSGTSLVAFYDWNDEASGFEDVDGQVSPVVPVDVGFHVVSALIYGTKVRVKMTDTIASIGTGSNIARVVYLAAGSSSRTILTASSATINGDMMIITLPSALPSDARGVAVELTNTNGFTRNVKSVKGLFAPTSAALTEVEFDNDSAPPSNMSIWVQPANNGCQVRADVFSPVGITKWQYRRFDGVQIIAGDANWVDINSNTDTINQHFSGLSNARKGARIELRAVVSDDQRVFGNTEPFDPSNTLPTIVSDDSNVDGQSIILTTTIPLRSTDRATTSAWAITLSSGASRTITHQRTIGNKIYLETSSPVPEGDTASIAYTRPSQTAKRITSEAGAYMATASGTTIENKTIDKLPGRPSFICAYRTYPNAAGTTIEWTDNFNAGSSVDRYEYRTRAEDSSQWSDWQVVNGNAARSTSFLSNAGVVQMRASNPNIRFADIFGLSIGYTPFMRPVKFPLTIGIDLRKADGLTGDVIESIRSSIASTISGYDLGSKIWANDIFAQVERVAGTEVKFDSTDTYVQYRGIGVNAANAHAVPLYAEWSVEPSDISIIFTD
ncbi:MAG: baseplate J/gp47 family protein [Gammaproteobacteria bacterium AqS3]|nr:baseplate J/gp47 family protein [Gammaproteobacteria bacterium AqS3]